MLKVLIVDDEAVVRRGIVLGIDWASLGCAVVGEAANGEEGLAAAERYSPNLIITDVRMPHMDGIEMMRVLRERGSTAHVIVLTAYNDFDYARSALRFGAADYLLKPFRDQELVAAIERVREKAEAFSSRSAQDDLLALPKGDKSKYVLQTLEYIAAHYADADINITTIARSIGISEGHLSHVFKKETSYTALGYLTLYRIHMARRLLADCRYKVYEVAGWSATAMSPTSARPSKSSPVSPPRSIRTAAGRTRKLHKKVRNIPDKLGGLSQHFAEMPA